MTEINSTSRFYCREHDHTGDKVVYLHYTCSICGGRVREQIATIFAAHLNYWESVLCLSASHNICFRCCGVRYPDDVQLLRVSRGEAMAQKVLDTFRDRGALA